MVICCEGLASGYQEKDHGLTMEVNSLQDNEHDATTISNVAGTHDVSATLVLKQDSDGNTIKVHT